MLRRLQLVALAVKAPLILFQFAAVAVCTAAAPPTATLEDELSRVVTIIKRNLGDAKEIAVARLTDLSANTRHSGAIGAGLREAVVAECARQSIDVRDAASHVLTGQFHVADADGVRTGEPLALTLQLGLTDRRGRQPVELLPIYAEAGAEHFATVTDVEIVAKAMGVVGVIPTTLVQRDDLASQAREQELVKIVEAPTGYVAGTRIRSAPESDFEVEILSARREGDEPLRPLEPVLDGGLPFVDIPHDHKYQIRIHNHSPESVAVIASIDGLSVFHFADDEYRDAATGRLLITHWVVPPSSGGGAGESSGGVRLIPGWFFRAKTPDNMADFVVSQYAESAAGQAGLSPEGAGAIHLQFAHCRKRIKVRGIGDKGTRLGDSQTIALTTSDCRPDVPFEYLTIRYDR